MKFSDQVSELVTSPTVAVPVVGTAGVMNVILDTLPVIINIGSAIYIVLLVCHKSYQMWQEYKAKKDAPSK